MRLSVCFIALQRVFATAHSQLCIKGHISKKKSKETTSPPIWITESENLIESNPVPRTGRTGLHCFASSACIPIWLRSHMGCCQLMSLITKAELFSSGTITLHVGWFWLAICWISRMEQLPGDSMRAPQWVSEVLWLPDSLTVVWEVGRARCLPV